MYLAPGQCRATPRPRRPACPRWAPAPGPPPPPCPPPPPQSGATAHTPAATPPNNPNQMWPDLQLSAVIWGHELTCAPLWAVALGAGGTASPSGASPPPPCCPPSTGGTPAGASAGQSGLFPCVSSESYTLILNSVLNLIPEVGVNAELSNLVPCPRVFVASIGR